MKALQRRTRAATATAQTADQPQARTRDPFAIRPARPRIEQTTADAAPLPNRRHELFAQGIAIGLPRDEAYERAGYNSSNAYAGATQLLSRSDIDTRIGMLQRRGAAQAATTIETLVAELEEARLLAKAETQPSAMVAATKEKAVLLGLRVEKSDVTTRPGDPKGLTDDELARIARGSGDGTAPASGDPAKPARMVH